MASLVTNGNETKSTGRSSNPITCMKKKKIFLSYRRTHSSDARALKLELKNLGYDEIFFDLDSIAEKGGEFQKQVDDAVASADAVIVMITPDPSGSEARANKDGGRFHLSSFETIKKYAKLGRTDYCAKEIERALFLGKLIIPVYYLRHAWKYGKTWAGDQIALLNDYPINKGGKVDALRDGSNEYFTGVQNQHQRIL